MLDIWIPVRADTDPYLAMRALFSRHLYPSSSLEAVLGKGAILSLYVWEVCHSEEPFEKLALSAEKTLPLDCCCEIWT